MCSASVDTGKSSPSSLMSMSSTLPFEQMARNSDTDLMEERAVEKFLCCMLKRYAQIVNSIEVLLDFE
jgi:hypothetical protein